MILKKRIAKKLFCKKVLEKEYFEKSSEKNYFEKSIGKQLFWEKVLEIRPDSVINPQNVRISLSGAAFLLFCRVLARPAKKKLGGKAFNVRVCREAVADRFPGIPGSLVERNFSFVESWSLGACRKRRACSARWTAFLRADPTWVARHSVRLEVPLKN